MRKFGYSHLSGEDVMSVLLGSDGVDFHVGLGFGRLGGVGRFYYSNVVFRVVLVGPRVLL
jgi:hypothetical protein